MAIVDPKLKVYNLLTSNWNIANTSNVLPKIHMGWYNAAWQPRPQVTIVMPSYIVRRGGDTGVSAIGPGGTNVRVMQVQMAVGGWAHHDAKDQNGADITVNPRQLSYEFANEIRRIIEANLDTDPELDWISWIDMSENVEMRVKPVLFRYDNTIRMLYRETF